MSANALIICALLLSAAGCFAEIILTQSPSVDLVSVGSSVTLNCRSSSSSLTKYLAWYQKRPGQTHKLLFYYLGNRVSGVSDRFTNEKSGTNYMLKIRDVQPEDAGDYYCQQYYDLPLTFGGGTRLDVGSVTPPKVSVLPPSSAEISLSKRATLVCVASEGFPSDWKLSWKVNGHIRSQESSAGLMQENALYSWSSSLTLTEDQWMTERGSVSCEATRSGQPTVSAQLTRDQCSP